MIEEKERTTYEKEARRFIEAIKALANNEEGLNNFEGYLTHHFPYWLKQWAKTVDGIVEEFEAFSTIL